MKKKQKMPTAFGNAFVDGLRNFAAIKPDEKRSIVTYANHGGGETAAYFIRNDGQHRVMVQKIMGGVVSISRCQLILNPDGK